MRHSISTRGRYPLLVGMCAVVVLLAGCPKPAEEEVKKLPLEGVALKLMVVDDADLAAAVEKARGEWKVQTGSTVEVVEVTEAELTAIEEPKADAAICASYLLGPLAEAGKLAEIPEALRAEGEEEWMDVFELARCHEVEWGEGKITAVPFGSPVLVCYYRSDLLDKLGKEPPTTWDEYRELAKLLGDRANLKDLAPAEGAAWSGSMEPLGPGWAGLALLARAAPGVQHPANYSTWFDMKTMRPLINSPAVVRALMQLVETAKHASADQLDADPAKVRQAFWQGKCGLAVTWPTGTASAALEKAVEGQPPAAGVVALPGSREHFDVDHGQWARRDRNANHRVPLLATSGRVGVVFRGQKHREAAELLLWLSARRGSPPLAARSPWTTLFRKSQTGSVSNWVESTMSDATAAAYAHQTQTTFESQQWVFALRIPGRAEYLAALDEAVAAAVRGEKPPAAALTEAAQRWHEITERLGIDRQRAAYQRSLGLEP